MKGSGLMFKMINLSTFPLRQLSIFSVYKKRQYLTSFFLQLIFFLGLANNHLKAENPQELFDKANTHFQNGNYIQAIQAYDSLLTKGFISKEVYYNLGNTYLKIEDLGNAVLNYERALLQKPGYKDARNNLSYARSMLIDDLETISPFFLKKWWDSLRQSASSTTWSIVALLILCSGIIGWIVWQFSGNRLKRKQGFFAGLILILISILPFALAASRSAFEYHSGQAIILEKEVALRIAADVRSREIYLLHEGTKVELIDEIETWKKVKLTNGEEGWLFGEALEEI